MQPLPVRWLAFGLTLLPSAAAAQDLPDLARDDGYSAAHAALLELVARTRPRHLGAALQSAGLDQLKMPVERSADVRDLVLEAGPAQSCLWAAEKLNCSIPLRASGPIANGDLEVSCQAEGTNAFVASTLAQVAGRWELLLPDLGACWRIDGTALEIRRKAPSPVGGR